MAKIFSWQLDDNIYAYLTGISDNEPFIGNKLNRAEYESVVGKVNGMSESQYETNFIKVCSLIKENEYDYDPTKNGLVSYLSYFDTTRVAEDTKSIVTDFMTVLEGKEGKQGPPGVPGEDGKDGETGAKADTPVPYIPVTAYCSTRDKDEPPLVPQEGEIIITWDDESKTYSFNDKNSRWFLFDNEANDNDGDGTNKSIIWQSSAIYNDKGIVSPWTTPFRITGEDGAPGTDGSRIEFIYTRRLFPDVPEVPDYSDPDKSLSELPEDDPLWDAGWTNAPMGIDEEYKYEYVCQRRKGEDEKWGEWVGPTLWSKWGEDGKDGDGVEYVYCLSGRKEVPGFSLDNDAYGMTVEEFIESDTYQTSGANEYRPLLTGTSWESTDGRWSDNPLTVTEELPYQWVLIRKRRRKDDKSNATWGPFDGPTLWSTYGEKGEQGIEGLSVFHRRCFVASGSTAPVVNEPTNMDPGFPWSTAIPDKKPEETIWCIEAYYKMDLTGEEPRNFLCFDDGAYSRINEETGETEIPQWSTPYVYEGRSGTNAVHIHEEIFRCLPDGLTKEEIMDQYAPENNPEEDWFLPVGWSRYAVGLSSGTPICYVWSRTRTGHEHFDEWHDWGEPEEYSRYSKDGEDAISVFKSTVFIRQNNPPTTPEGGNFYHPIPETKTVDGVIEKWEDGVPKGDEKLWASTRTFASDEDSDLQDKTWSEPAQMTDTASFEVIYGVEGANFQALPKLPITKEGFTNEFGWYDNDTDIQNEGKEIIYMATASAKNGEWGEWSVSKIKGERGEDGHSIFKSTVFVRREEEPPIPEGGSYFQPFPTISQNKGIPWEDGIPSGDTILWASTRTFSLDENSDLHDKSWSRPTQMTDTASFEVIYGVASADTTNLPPIPIQQGMQNYNGWYDEDYQIDNKEIYFMATATAKNGVWSKKWTVTKIKGEDARPINIKGTFKTLKEFEDAVAGPDHKSPPADPSDAYIVAGCLWIWDILNEIWVNTGRYGGNDGISVFKSTAFIRQNNKPIRPSGGTFNRPLPNETKLADGTIEKWEDGIPSGDSILWATTRAFASDVSIDLYEDEWSEPRKMTDTASFETAYGTIKVTDYSSISAGLPVDENGNAVQNATGGFDFKYGWTDEPKDGEEYYYMATATANNGVWSKWTVSKIKGENGKSINIKATFKTLKEFEDAVAGPDHKRAPEDISDAYVVAGDLWIWDVMNKEWKNIGRFAGTNGTNGIDGETTEFVFFLTQEYDITNKPKHYYVPRDGRKTEEEEKEYAYSHKDYFPAANEGGFQKWVDEPQGVDRINKCEWIKQRNSYYDKEDGVVKWSDFGDATLFAKWGENGKDGDDIEYVYCYTKSEKDRPFPMDYSNNSPEAQKADFCPEVKWNGVSAPTDLKEVYGNIKVDAEGNSKLYWMDNAMGVSAEWPCGWEMVRKRKGTKNPSTDANDDEYIYTWDKYTDNSVTLHAKWGRDGDEGRAGVAGVPGISYESRYMLGRVDEEDPDKIFLFVPEIKNGEFTGNNVEYEMGSDEWKEYWENTLHPETETKLINTRYLDKQKYPLYTSHLNVDKEWPYVFFVQSRIVTQRTKDENGKYLPESEWNEILEGGSWEGPFRVTGSQGIQGPEGKAGPILYSAGVYGLGKKYYVDDVKKPYVLDPEDKEFYYLNTGNGIDADKKEYWFGDPDGTGDSSFNTPSKSVANNKTNVEGKPYWVKMEQFDVILANVGVFRSALVGSGVFYGDWFYSQNGSELLSEDPMEWSEVGTDTNYENFPVVGDDNRYNGRDFDWKKGDFRPVMALNLNDGSGWFANESIRWYSDGFVSVDGVLKDDGTGGEGTVGGNIIQLQGTYTTINTTLTNLNTEVTSMQTTVKMLNDLGSDEVITIYEIESLKNLRTQLEIEFRNLSEQANTYEVDMGNFESAYNNAIATLDYYTNKNNFSNKQIEIIHDDGNGDDSDYDNIAKYYEARESFQNKLEIAVIKENSSAGGVDEAEWTKLKNEFAQQFGYASYDDLLGEALEEGDTLIKGGYINTDLIDAKTLVAKDAFIQNLKVRQLNTTGGELAGTIDIQGNEINVYNNQIYSPVLTISGGKFHDFSNVTIESKTLPTMKYDIIMDRHSREEQMLSHLIDSEYGEMLFDEIGAFSLNTPKVTYAFTVPTTYNNFYYYATDIIKEDEDIYFRWNDDKITELWVSLGFVYVILKGNKNISDYGSLYESEGITDKYRLFEESLYYTTTNQYVDETHENMYGDPQPRVCSHIQVKNVPIYYDGKFYSSGDEIYLTQGNYYIFLGHYVSDSDKSLMMDYEDYFGMVMVDSMSHWFGTSLNTNGVYKASYRTYISRCEINKDGFKYISTPTKYAEFTKNGTFKLRNEKSIFFVSDDGIFMDFDGDESEAKNISKISCNWRVGYNEGDNGKSRWVRSTMLCVGDKVFNDDGKDS